MKKFTAPRNVAQIDRETGEVIDGVFAIMPVRQKNAFSEGWFAMSNFALAQILTLITNRALTLRDIEVLFSLLEVLELENFIRISQRQISEKIDMLQPNVSRSIRTLIRHGVILEGPKIGPSSTYRLNPRFGWKGSGKAHLAAIKEMNAFAKKATVIPLVAEPQRDPATIDMFTGKPDCDANC